MNEIDLNRFSPLWFVFNNDIRNEGGERLEFKDHRFLMRPYDDMSPRQVIRKAAQVGWSTLAIIKSLWLAKFERANIIYTLPSKSIVKDFVQPKCDPIINGNQIFKDWVGKAESVSLKSIGDRFIYFRGSWEQESAISISAHILVNDEVDRSNQKVLRVYKTRLDDAKRERPDLGFIWQFSNPSVPGNGVDVWWGESDQKHWFVKCPHCNYDYYLQWPENVNLETKQYVCGKCHKELTNDNRRNGRWVKKYLNREISSYWLSQMMCSWIPASKIIEDSKGDKQIFHNFTLGLPYVSEDQKINRKNITDCIVPTSNHKANVAMGVDNGVVKTVVVGNTQGIFEVFETESWEEIERKRNQYNAKMVIDANPYPNMPRKLAEKYPGYIFVHYFYTQEKKDIGIIDWGTGDKMKVVQSDRVKIIDLVVSEIINKDIIFNLTVTQLEQYIYDWCQLYRTIEENAKGVQKPVWLTIEGRRDHFCFSTIYWRIALEKTFATGGVITTPSHKKQQEHPIINLDQTMKAIDPQKILERVRNRNDWRLK